MASGVCGGSDLLRFCRFARPREVVAPCHWGNRPQRRVYDAFVDSWNRTAFALDAGSGAIPRESDHSRAQRCRGFGQSPAWRHPSPGRQT